MIAIVNYGVGNLFSLSSSVRFLGIDAMITADADEIRKADRIILPGVGAFEDAKRKLEETGLIPVIKEETASGKPLLGICLGMQMLFDESHEYGIHKGLSLIGGKVVPMGDHVTENVKIPHMGWNELKFKREDPLFKYVNEGEYVYYVHSYYAKADPESIIATSLYGGIDITGAVGRGKIYGTQFHPEKSGETGLKILKAFSEI